MKQKQLYLILAIIGFVAPYYFLDIGEKIEIFPVI
jgi:hypothetical protein